MGSNRSSPNGADWTDVAGIMVAFEGINNVRLEVRIAVTDHRGLADLAVAVVASERKCESGVPRVLGSQNVTCSGTNRKTLEDVLILALYGLDAQLASDAFTEFSKSG